MPSCVVAGRKRPSTTYHSFAEKLAAQKAHLLLTARREQNLEALAVDLRSQYNVTVDYFKSDLSRADAPWQIYENLNDFSNIFHFLNIYKDLF